jgi:hypothetical protein
VNGSAVGPIGNDLFEKEQGDISKTTCDCLVSYHVSYVLDSDEVQSFIMNDTIVVCSSASLSSMLEL